MTQQKINDLRVRACIWVAILACVAVILLASRCQAGEQFTGAIALDDDSRPVTITVRMHRHKHHRRAHVKHRRDHLRDDGQVRWQEPWQADLYEQFEYWLYFDSSAR